MTRMMRLRRLVFPGPAETVRFVARLRGEVKFDGVDALVEQIGRDCDDARAILST